jgi:hypothetical protein
MRAVMGADAGDLRRCRGRLLRLVVALNARSPVIYPKERVGRGGLLACRPCPPGLPVVRQADLVACLSLIPGPRCRHALRSCSATWAIFVPGW